MEVDECDAGFSRGRAFQKRKREDAFELGSLRRNLSDSPIPTGDVLSPALTTTIHNQYIRHHFDELQKSRDCSWQKSGESPEHNYNHNQQARRYLDRARQQMEQLQQRQSFRVIGNSDEGTATQRKRHKPRPFVQVRGLDGKLTTLTFAVEETANGAIHARVILDKLEEATSVPRSAFSLTLNKEPIDSTSHAVRVGSTLHLVQQFGSTGHPERFSRLLNSR